MTNIQLIKLLSKIPIFTTYNTTTNKLQNQDHQYHLNHQCH